jgi:predicted N-acetyltransferase YhbS
VVVKGLETAAEREGALRVLGLSFPKAPSPGMERHTRLALWRGPVFRPEHTRIVLVDGRVVSVVVMGPRMFRFGPVSVPGMTVGPVATDEAFRGRGYAAMAMNDASRYMERNGILLADLQGNRKLYARFGYYGFQWTGEVSVMTCDADKEATPGRLRPMRRADLPHVADLFRRATAGRIMAADRSPEMWRWLLDYGSRTWLFRRPRVILDGRRRFRGYLTATWGEGFGVCEIVVRDDDASRRAALGALVREAKAAGTEEFGLSLPWDDPLAAFLRQVVGSKHSIVCRRGGGPLLKIVDFPALMRKLQPLFSERWSKARGRVSGGPFTLRTESGQLAFRFSAGAARVDDRPAGPRANVPQKWLSGLLCGSTPVADIVGREGVRIPPDLMEQMDVLFPRGWPFWYRGDMY